MAILIKCPGCDKAMAAPESAAGHRAKCPHCGDMLTIPGTSTAELASVVIEETREHKAAEAAAAGAEQQGHRGAAGGPPARPVEPVFVASEDSAEVATAVPPTPASPASLPTPSRTSGASSSRTSATAIDRMLLKKSPYGSLRLLAAVGFGVGVVMAVLAFLGAAVALVLISIGGQPLVGVGVFAGGLVAALLIFLAAKTAYEVLRLWADVGDRIRQVTHLLEESMNRPHDETR